MPNVPVPCYWTEPGEPPCAYRCGLQALGRHIKRNHKSEGAYGCVHCGFTHDSKLVIRGHQCPSPDFKPPKGKIPKSHYATARYYRKLYQQTSRFASTIPLAAFWCQSDKHNEKQPEPEPDTTVDTVGEDSLDSASDDDQKPVSDNDQQLAAHRCSECQAIITPYTISGIIQHRLFMGHKTIIDLNPLKLLKDNPQPPLDNLPGDFYDPSMMDNQDDHDSDFDELEALPNAQPELDSALALDTNEDSDETQDDANSSSETTKAQPKFNDRQLKAMQEAHQRELYQTFIDCVKPEHHEVVRDILDKYEEADWCRGNSAKKSIMIAMDLIDNFKPETVVYALRKDGGWYCQVPQCGATYNLDLPFAIKLHLEAHGTIKWYCGDASSFNCSETAYESRKEVDAHIAAEHMGSAYSYQAVRCVPKLEVSESLLSNWIDFEGPVRILQGGRDAEEDESNDELCASAWELEAWLALGERKSHGRQKDFDIRDYSAGKSFCLAKPPVTWENVKRIPQGHIRLLLATWSIDEEVLVRVLETYHAFCTEIGTYNAKKVLIRLLEESRLPFKNTAPRCPWPGCGFSDPGSKTQELIHHFVICHLECRWHCPEEGCEYCAYRNPKLLERHRMFCHVGSPLQCGDRECGKVMATDWNSRGHILDRRLRDHNETIFNAKLAGLGPNAVPSDPGLSSETETPYQGLPSLEEYLFRFSQHSSKYFTYARRAYRRAANAKVLAKHQLRFEDTRPENGSTCSGFWCQNRHYPCADSVALGIDTTRLLFVPAKMLFTVANTCDFCVFVMSVLFRPLANIPYPFEFGLKGGVAGTNKRVGIASSIMDHASFLQVAAKHPLILTPMAEKYRSLKKTAPHKIFIVDFESVPILQKGLPICPTEVTFRDGNNKIIESCIINAKGMTNIDFEEKLRNLGYTHRKSFESARRIRGSRKGPLKGRARTPKEILQVLREHGFGPDAFWVEYSVSLYDRRCMEIVIKDAGESPDGILPPPTRCWTVCSDFMRALPGLGSSYTLGNVAKLMNPTILKGLWLHHSSADTFVLYDLLHRWIDIYGRGGNFSVEG